MWLLMEGGQWCNFGQTDILGDLLKMLEEKTSSFANLIYGKMSKIVLSTGSPLIFGYGIIRCGYTGHFYRGKLPFYHGKLYLVVWPTLPEVNFPCKISMDTSKGSVEAPMTFNVGSWKGVLMPEVQEPIAMLMKLWLNFPPMNCVRFRFTSVIFVTCDP